MRRRGTNFRGTFPAMAETGPGIPAAGPPHQAGRRGCPSLGCTTTLTCVHSDCTRCQPIPPPPRLGWKGRGAGRVVLVSRSVTWTPSKVVRIRSVKGRARTGRRWRPTRSPPAGHRARTRARRGEARARVRRKPSAASRASVTFRRSPSKAAVRLLTSSVARGFPDAAWLTSRLSSGAVVPTDHRGPFCPRLSHLRVRPLPAADYHASASAFGLLWVSSVADEFPKRRRRYMQSPAYCAAIP